MFNLNVKRILKFGQVLIYSLFKEYSLQVQSEQVYNMIGIFCYFGKSVDTLFIVVLSFQKTQNAACSASKYLKNLNQDQNCL